MSRSTMFLVMDECSYEQLDLMALTGILIPSDAYADITHELHQLEFSIYPPVDNVLTSPNEFHANKLLLDQPIEIKISCISSFVNIINKYNLNIIRGAYLNRSEIASRMKGDPKLYGLIFPGLLSSIETLLEDHLIIPIMDGVPGHVRASSEKAPRIDKVLIKSFADFIYHAHYYRCHEGLRDSMIVKNSHNLGEATFVDSSQSRLLQLVDMASYLLLQLDRANLEKAEETTEYRKLVLECAKKIDPKLIRSQVVKMKFHE